MAADLVVAYFALRSHFMQRPGEQFTLQQAHELWNQAWPAPEEPLYLTEKALEALEREGAVVKHNDKTAATWRRT